MELRKANKDDAKQLLEWRNDEATRKNSFSSEVISLDEHLRWLDKRLKDPKCHMFILEDEGNALGNIRLDILDDEGKIGEISYVIAPKFRGKGYGSKVLALVEEKAKEIGVSTLTGLVKAENTASRRCFEKQKYTSVVGGPIVTYIKLL